MPDFPDNLGIVAAGYGAVVLPGPEIDPDWNLRIRDYGDGEFRWGGVVGLEPTPDEGYEFQQPAFYQLEITPDLGWANTEAMFESYIHGESEYGNARLGTFVLAIADLTNNGDTSFSYTLSQDQMKKILAPGYVKYLWRVRAISERGSLGHPSSIQTFRGRVVIPDTAWDVKPLPTPARNLTATIVGTKTGSITEVEINGSLTLVRFLSDTQWTAEVPLAGGRNVFAIRVYDAQGNSSPYKQVETELTSNDLATRSYWNRFDDFGYLLGLERLPEERNDPYRDRLTDVFVHRAGFRYTGLMNGINRELGLTCEDRMIYLQPGTQAESAENFQVIVWLNASGIYLFSPRMTRRQEYHEVDPHTLCFEITDYKAFSSLILEQPLGVEIPRNEYRLEDGKIYLLDQARASRPVYATYSYVMHLPTRGKAVSQLKAELNSLTIDGDQLVVVTDGTGYSPTASADGLRRFPPIRLQSGTYLDVAGEEIEGKLPVAWSSAKLFAFQDDHFRDRYVNRYGSKFNTQYDAWAMRMKKFMHTTWGYLVADENVWSHPKKPVSGLGVLESVYDAHLGTWRSSNPAHTWDFSAAEAAHFGYIDPQDGSALYYVGVPVGWFHCGVGDGDDLFVRVTEEDEEDDTPDEQVTIVQTSTETAVDDDELHLGVSVVDSTSEVA